jgi:hypothetical protein
MTNENLRPETGPMEFPEDWPGIFIRGDHAVMYKMAIQAVLKDFQTTIKPNLSGRDIIQWTIVEGLADLLASCIVRDGVQPDTQKAYFQPTT